MNEKLPQEIEPYQKSVKKAKDIIESLQLEEPYKTNAFNTILRDLLDECKFPQKKMEHQQNFTQPKEKVLINFAKVPYFDNFDKLNWKFKLLNILQWAKYNHAEKGLMTSEFVEIFRERFGMPYIDSGKINKEITRRLQKTPLITRTRINQRNFRWFITPKGEEYLKKEGNNEIQS